MSKAHIICQKCFPANTQQPKHTQHTHCKIHTKAKSKLFKSTFAAAGGAEEEAQDQDENIVE